MNRIYTHHEHSKSKERKKKKRRNKSHPNGISFHVLCMEIIIFFSVGPSISAPSLRRSRKKHKKNSIDNFGCNHIEWLLGHAKPLTENNSNYLLFSQVEIHHGCFHSEQYSDIVRSIGSKREAALSKSKSGEVTTAKRSK